MGYLDRNAMEWLENEGGVWRACGDAIGLKIARARAHNLL
jgi:hypothetical protein